MNLKIFDVPPTQKNANIVRNNIVLEILDVITFIVKFGPEKEGNLPADNFYSPTPY